jgi:hypothetical protein
MQSDLTTGISVNQKLGLIRGMASLEGTVQYYSTISDKLKSDLIKGVLLYYIPYLVFYGIYTYVEHNHKTINFSGCGHMVFGFTTTYAISAYHH